MKHHFSVYEVGKNLKQTEYIWYAAHVHLSSVHVLLSKIYPDKTCYLDETHIIRIFSSFFQKLTLSKNILNFCKNSPYPKEVHVY
jgi:hypothetical protein